MEASKFLIASLIVLLGYLFYLLKPPLLQSQCDTKNCPYCIGRNLCKDLSENKVILEYNSFRDFFYNIFSVKNVYFAKYNGISVIVKNLGTSCENLILQNDASEILFSENDQTLSDFKVCSNDTYQIVLKEFSNEPWQRYLLKLIRHNAEPLLLKLFPSDGNWPVPYFYGCCGKLLIVKNSGRTLNELHDASWIHRAFISKQLLEGAVNLSVSHEKYRLYLTDISPDNIAVDDHFKVTFTDLENGLLAENYEGTTVHATSHFPDENYMYSEKEICHSSVSDHNIYSICRLILSKNAPWPMMRGGLLHSPPQNIVEKYKALFSDIELCVIKINARFKIATKIISMLSDILNTSVHKNM